MKFSSSLSTSSPTGKSNPSYMDTSRQSVSATPTPTTQKKLDQLIESELYNAIFHYPNFIQRFLSGNALKLDQVHQECRMINSDYAKGQWKLPSKALTEKSLYEPVLRILNTIKKAVNTVNTSMHTTSSQSDPGPASSSASTPTTPDNDSSGDYIPDQPEFLDTSAYTMPSDYAETQFIKPDLVLFEDIGEQHRHWEHVRMPIEIKKRTGHHKAAMKQLSRYARAVFAHQLHRSHLYAMMVCNTEATFVRFDRAGILYSRRVNLRTDSKAFTYAFASLLMLDQIDQGYIPAFTWQMNGNGRLEYHVDLPISEFTNQTSGTNSVAASKETKTHRFQVVDILCGRMSICGRATVVLRICKVEEGGGDDLYILKVMWRDPERGMEGDVLLKAKGRFGLAQHVWHRDAFGKCRCLPPKVNVGWGCKKCALETAQVVELEVCDQLTNIAIEVPPEDEAAGNGAVLDEIDTTVCRPTTMIRLHRICTFIMSSSSGVPLDRAQSSQEFMKAVLDAILGYWGLYNLGILHRDISNGNVLLLDPDHQFDLGDHNLSSKNITDKLLIESEEKLHEVLNQLERRGPSGMLSDYDLYAEHSSLLCDVPTGETANSQSKDYAEDDLMVATPSIPSIHSRPLSPCASGLVHPRQGDSLEDTRESKRRKTTSRSDGVVMITQTGTKYVPTSGQGTEKKRLINFRTGTPAFMSARVTEVMPGEEYHHLFLDDLESFFWLVFWSAAAHLDEGAKKITDSAQSTLDQLAQQDPGGSNDYKVGLLQRCDDDGTLMRKRLKDFRNSWASDPLFTAVVLKFGKLALEYYKATMRGENISPVAAFPRVVAIFQDALSSSP